MDYSGEPMDYSGEPMDYSRVLYPQFDPPKGVEYNGMNGL